MRSHSPTPTIHIMDGTPHIKLFTDEFTSAMILSNFSISVFLFSFSFLHTKYDFTIHCACCARKTRIHFSVHFSIHFSSMQKAQMRIIHLRFFILYFHILLSVLQHLSRHDLVQSADQNSVDYEVENNYSAVEHSPEPWGKCQLNAAVYI